MGDACQERMQPFVKKSIRPGAGSPGKGPGPAPLAHAGRREDQAPPSEDRRDEDLGAMPGRPPGTKPAPRLGRVSRDLEVFVKKCMMGGLHDRPRAPSPCSMNGNPC